MFLGDFWEVTGLGTGFRGDFATDGAPTARWASADLGAIAKLLRVAGLRTRHPWQVAVRGAGRSQRPPRRAANPPRLRG